MQTIWKKITPYFIGISLFGSSSALAWEVGWIELLVQHFWEESIVINTEIVPSVIDSLTLLPKIRKDTLQAPIEDIITWIDSEEELHTSKIKDTPDFTKQQNYQPSENRVGCICMDDNRQNKQGTGACSGHGGVRFWLHQQDNGLILEFPTLHHKKHPAPLSFEELSKLVSYKSKQKRHKDTNPNPQSTFLDMLMLFIVCLTIAYVAKLWWEKY
jgi:hypothetical protein